MYSNKWRNLLGGNAFILKVFWGEKPGKTVVAAGIVDYL
jgi:hypothetical protein